MHIPIRTSGTLGPLLKRMRRAKKLSQTDLGRLIGLSQERISVIESAPEKVTMDNLLTVMMALGGHFSVCEGSSSGDTEPAGGVATTGDW